MTPDAERTRFFLLVSSRDDERCARLLLESLRAFGGALSGCPVWAFVPGEASDPGRAPAIGDARVVSLEVDPRLDGYPFARKVTACARAEEMASGEDRSLVWLSPQCLFVDSPQLLGLRSGIGAAFRPVHIRNVGSRAAEPLDGFWRAVYRVVGLDGAPWTVESLVDSEVIRPYYNTHLFSVDPSAGLLRTWLERFRSMVADRAFQEGPCADGLRKVFLHQAVLSALVSKVFGRERIRELPLEYSYPLHLHSKVPPALRPRVLNELVCPVYEGAYEHPATLGGLDALEPLASWLVEHGARKTSSEGEPPSGSVRGKP